jgi:hypothetical protein
MEFYESLRLLSSTRPGRSDAKTIPGSKNLQVAIINRLRKIFEASFAVVGLDESSDGSGTAEFSARSGICNSILHEKSLLRHRVTCNHENHNRDSPIRSDPVVITNLRAPLLSIFRDSFTISRPPCSPHLFTAKISSLRLINKLDNFKNRFSGNRSESKIYSNQ